MKKFRVLYVFILLIIINFVHAENVISVEDYLDQCSTIMNNNEDEIRIFTRDNRSIKAEFIRFVNDSLSYFNILNYHEEQIPLIEVNHIVVKNNKSAFDGDYYVKKFHKDYLKNIDNAIEYISKDMQYNRRTVNALEKIARAQTYFMIYSAITTFIALILFII